MAKLPGYFKLVVGLPTGPTGETPSEFRLFAFGKTGTTKGEFGLDQESAEACLAAYQDYGNRLTIDYEHMALVEPPIPAPAAASFVLELRTDGLWATDVRWTDKAAQHLRSKEYLYFSPAFMTDNENRVSRILNVALTNLPATKNMAPLVAAKHSEEQPMKMVLSALSLKESANEAEALSAVTKLQDGVKQLTVLTGKPSVEEALGVVAAWKDQAAESVLLKAEVAKQKLEQTAVAFETEFAAAQKMSLLAASEDHKRNKHALSFKGKDGGLEMLRGYISTLDPLVPGAVAPVVAGKEPAVGEGGVIGLTAEEKRIADKMNLKHEVVLKNKVRLALKAKQPAVHDNTDEEDAA